MANPYNYSKPKTFQGKPQNTVKRQIRPATAEKSNNDKYLEQKVLAAKPEELTFMLFEGTVKFIKKAKIFNAEKNVEKTHQMIMRAEAIITELRSTLDMKYEVSEQLDNMYEYMNRRLGDANMQKSNEILDEVLELAEDLMNTWKEAMPNMR